MDGKVGKRLSYVFDILVNSQAIHVEGIGILHSGVQLSERESREIVHDEAEPSQDQLDSIIPEEAQEGIG